MDSKTTSSFQQSSPPSLDPLIENELQDVTEFDLTSAFFVVDMEMGGNGKHGTPSCKRHDLEGMLRQRDRVSLETSRRVSLTKCLAGLLNELDNITSSEECRFDSLLAIPVQHTTLKHSLASADPQKSKKPRINLSTNARNELHVLCCKTDVSVAEIQDAIARDPSAPSRQATVPVRRKVYNPVTCKLETKRTCESYKYPLNLAIRYKASLDVITTLLAAAPEVSDLADGPQQEKSLHIVLKHSPRDMKAVDTLLLHNPKPISPFDRIRNTVLHTACRYGASLSVIRHLIIMFPDALHTRNFHNESVAELAQRHSVMCTQEVASYIMQQTNKGLTKQL
jgi:hypothetical protein